MGNNNIGGVLNMEFKKLKKKKLELFNGPTNCVICQKPILFDEDRYVQLTDYNKGKYEAHCFYHLTCWKLRDQIGMQKAMEKYGPLLNKFLGGIEEC